jgi:TusA-related sulfurtransferase
MESPLSKPSNSAFVALDLCGLRCPHLLINVIAAIRSLAPQQQIQIRATDLNAPSSISSWAQQSGNELLDMYQEGDCFIFLLEKKANDVTIIEEEPTTVAQKGGG